MANSNSKPARISLPLLLSIVAFALLLSARLLASTWIDYNWWREVRQLDTWLNLLLYGTMPVIVVALIFFVVFAWSWRRGVQLSQGRAFRLSPLTYCALLIAAILLALTTVDSWTIIRYFAGLKAPSGAAEFVDPEFGQPLRFYFFQLPLLRLLLRVLLASALVSFLLFWLGSNLDRLRLDAIRMSPSGTIDLQGLSFRHVLESGFVRYLGAIALIGLAARYYLARYDLLFEDHGAYLVGMNWIGDHIVLPLQWLMIIGSLLAAATVFAGKARFALLLVPIFLLRFVLPPLIGSLYVRPNELNLERPYISQHIEATRAAYKLQQQLREVNLAAETEIPISYAKHKPLLDNVRLWDWRAFHDTVSQLQPLRPYSYLDSDVDRYTIDGQLRQVLISPRELDVRQLGDARNRWINPHFVYTHGYGIVLAEANRITSNGLPKLFVEDAPPDIHTKSLSLTRPEIYYGEVAHEPVFVNTSQPEFNYPSGGRDVYVKYAGAGGFPASPLLTRLAAAITYGDLNILLTSNLTSGSRMMIRRQIVERVSKLAGFVKWDTDPYLVLDRTGHLVWLLDGYLSSESHPYARDIDVDGLGHFNYIRNSVKATIDAYTGVTNLYSFDEADPLIAAYTRLFPDLFKPAATMPADLRAHVRYPEMLFNVQAEMFRTLHMREAEAFYNRADLWDIAKSGSKQQGAANQTLATYVVAALPGEQQPEFLLVVPFTPANKDNLIGFMAARCDMKHYGELVVERLSKNKIIYGPMQMEARMNQDQVISKDLSLWNQQGSEVLRGQTLVLPIENSFLYVVPIYIQASQARMPQLKKVVVAMGNKLAYADTYEQALSQLIGDLSGNEVTALPVATSQSAMTPNLQLAPDQDSQRLRQTLGTLKDHLRRYRELTSQGKLGEAGRELEEIDRLINKQ